MKILVDSAMPNALEVFSPYGEVVLKPGRDIVGEDLKDIDALMIRSVTKVDEKLLAGASKLKFVGTATANTNIGASRRDTPSHKKPLNKEICNR